MCARSLQSANSRKGHLWELVLPNMFHSASFRFHNWPTGLASVEWRLELIDTKHSLAEVVDDSPEIWKRKAQYSFYIKLTHYFN